MRHPTPGTAVLHPPGEGSTPAGELRRDGAAFVPPSGRHRRTDEILRRDGKSLRRAFTLAELLVVIALIVLLLALAVPALNLISGNRSVEGAINSASAMLTRARAEAIGLQRVRGVYAAPDPVTGRVKMALVQAVEFGTFVSGTTYSKGDHVKAGARYYCATATTSNPPPSSGWVEINADAIDMIPDTDVYELPANVGMQMFIDSKWLPGGGHTTDRYLHYGAVLFDGKGMLAARDYCVAYPSRLGQAFGYDKVTGPTNLPSTAAPPGNDTLQSSVGFVLFDLVPFEGRGSTRADSRGDAALNTLDIYVRPGLSSPAYNPDELNEEAWLDQNGTPVLVNRYNGTLIRGE